MVARKHYIIGNIWLFVVCSFLVGICCSFAHFMSLLVPLFSLLFSSLLFSFFFILSSFVFSCDAVRPSLSDSFYSISVSLDICLSLILCFDTHRSCCPKFNMSYFLPPRTLGSSSAAHIAFYLRSPPTCMNYDLKSPAGHSARPPSTMHLQLSSLTTFLIHALTASRS